MIGVRHGFVVVGFLTTFAWACDFNPRVTSFGDRDGGAGSVGAAGSGLSTGAGGITGAGGRVLGGSGGSVVATGGGGSAGSGSGGATTTGTGTGTGGAPATTGAGGAGGSTGTPSCNPNGPQCNNCKDDDGDGLIDAADPECVSALDNDESSFGTGIPGDNMDPCKQDCFFDGNSGAGDDGCNWNLKCDPLSPGANAAKACPYDANYHNCPTTQSQQCLTVCRTVTPNGCDCFGCCLVPGAPNAIYLAPTCTAAAFNDPTKCPPCTQVAACNNPCGHCEICVGKPTLPPDCFPPPGTGGGTGTDGGAGGMSGAGGAPGTGGAGGDVPCSGQPYCGPGGIDPTTCPASTYCITGCCIPIVQ